MEADWSRMIAVAVVPAAIISACGLMCLAFYNRLAALVGRIRGFQQQRITVTKSLLQNEMMVPPMQRLLNQRTLQMLDGQIQQVTQRAHWIRRTLCFLLATIAMLVICSIASALTIVWPWTMVPAMAAFVIGLGLFLAAIGSALRELNWSLEPAELESRFLTELDAELIAGEECKEDESIAV